ncbi:sugar phosphate isomerase/epimerase [Neolewinella aurantiaca]|uniref:Sugar phosphate isomerase/epimerase n=1 Tax=Neolewinella aurantiaca TaxID=2602767 RepID=A0A5C7FMS6_9BACT|nr:sugar phosphate isomerase/epimerase [Neolewinella aurantiaca]TXF91442.1 sugar phosphate isomerase/epimerase [Neolewinella aurantiaca]
MTNIKGPAIFLAQFMGDEAPFNSLDGICKYMADLGYKGVQVPTWDSRLIDLEKCASSKTYADELKGKVAEHGLEITELASHLQGQLVASHPAYYKMYEGFAPAEVAGNQKATQEWAVQQMKWNAKASQNLGISAHPSFSGALLWPYLYPWPQRPAGLVEEAFGELAKRWTPILDVFDECGVDVAYELHPGEDLFDGTSFERFLEATNNHARVTINYDPSHFVLQCLDYLQFIDIYHERISAYHVKDAEFNPTGRQGVYSGYSGWADRAGRFRSLGDGQVDFKSIFTKLAQYGYDGWAVLEWECAIKSSAQGAAEGAPFITDHLIQVTERAFDDFADAGTDAETNRKILGLG